MDVNLKNCLFQQISYPSHRKTLLLEFDNISVILTDKKICSRQCITVILEKAIVKDTIDPSEGQVSGKQYTCNSYFYFLRFYIPNSQLKHYYFAK